MQTVTTRIQWLRTAALAMLLVLGGCGGGGGGGSDPGSDPGSPPVADAGADRSVDGGDTISLAGSATDADGGALTLSWRQVAGTPVTLSTGTSGTATFTAPAGNADALLTFRLTATDAQGKQDTDDVAITVTTPAVALISAAAIDPTDLVTSGARAFFAAGGDGAPPASELWVTDATTAGTRLVRSFASGGQRIRDLTPFAGGVFFSATERGEEWAMWYSDGSADGTVKLDATVTGARHVVRPMGVYLGRFWYWTFVVACTDPESEPGCDGAFKVSDGTLAGTHVIRELQFTRPSDLETHATAVFQGKLHFYKDGKGLQGDALGQASPSLLASDGTPGNLRTVISTSQYDEGGGSREYALAVYRGRLYFNWRDDIEYDVGIYTYDGTTVSPFFDVSPGYPVFDASPLHLLPVGDQLLFSAFQPADPGNRQRALWATDGTVAGTRVLAAVELAPEGKMVAFKGRHYFRARAHGTQAWRLWSTDGTTAGTRPVGPLVTPDDWSTTPRMVVLGDLLLFQGSDGVSGFEPWVTDGTDAGTRLLRDIRPGAGDSYPQLAGAGAFAVHGSKAYFVAAAAPDDFRLYETDGTPQGTRLVPPPPYTAVAERTAGHQVDGQWRPNVPPVRAGQALVFAANFTAAGTRLYRIAR